MSSPQSYTTDIAYPSLFGTFQTPISMSYIAACRGRKTPDLAGPFTYSDLACGDATTLEMLAVCYPHGHFIGFDFNREHIDRGRQRLRDTGVRNVELIEIDIANLSSEELPASDFISISGAYSWVSESVRRHVNRLFADCLKEHGLAFVHYAAQPGCGQLDSLYQLAQSLSGPGDSQNDSTFNDATTIIADLKNNGALFFRENKLACSAIDAWKGAIDSQLSSPRANDFVLRAITHEAMNARQNGFYFSQIESEFKSLGLAFVGRAIGTENYPELALPKQLAAPIMRIDGMASRQMAYDIAANTAARRDIFARTTNTTSDKGKLFIDELFLCRLSAGDTRERLKSVASADLYTQPIDILLKAVTQRPAKWWDVASAKELKSFDAGEVRKSIELLVAIGMLQLILKPVDAVDASTVSQVKMTSKLNERQLRNGLTDPVGSPLVAPAAGTQINMPPSDRMMLFVLTGGEPKEAWEFFKTRGDVPAEAKTEAAYNKFLQALDKNLENFKKLALPSLLTLGIVEPV